MTNNNFAFFEEKMRSNNIPDVAIQIFEYYYAQLLEGNTGYIRTATIEPLVSPPNTDDLLLGLDAVGRQALSQTVTIKLNGGLGTSMGLDSAKSLLPVKEGFTFLDVIAQQSLDNHSHLLLMNSFSTRDDSLKLLKEKYAKLFERNLDVDFLQHKVPKVSKADFLPATWQKNPALEWCPPGHGNIYPALVTSKMLDDLLNAGFKYAFISNADNLGAVVDETILGYFAENEIPFLMEVTKRTAMDRKGGFPVRHKSGGLVLWETAQCHPDEMDEYQDITRFTHTSTNNIWVNLEQLKVEMEKMHNNLQLTMIRNEKTVDPQDGNSPKVYQLETAMGAAISVFAGAQVIEVPRSRFSPVKSTNELLAVRSDAYVLTSDFRVTLNPQRELPPPVIFLDAQYYKMFYDLDARFPTGAPSLIHCEKLEIEGDVLFGENVKLNGKVKVINTTDEQVRLENITLDNEVWQV
jgi:UTP--glucose-1-phosphate uridylyltransferase